MSTKTTTDTQTKNATDRLIGLRALSVDSDWVECYVEDISIGESISDPSKVVITIPNITTETIHFETPDVWDTSEYAIVRLVQYIEQVNQPILHISRKGDTVSVKIPQNDTILKPSYTPDSETYTIPNLQKIRYGTLVLSGLLGLAALSVFQMDGTLVTGVTPDSKEYMFFMMFGLPVGLLLMFLGTFFSYEVLFGDTYGN